MTRDELQEALEHHECQLAIGFDSALVGIGERFNATFAVYDRAKVIAQLEAMGMTNEDAEEFFSFNVVGAWVGDGTPCFVSLCTEPTSIPTASAAAA